MTPTTVTPFQALCRETLGNKNLLKNHRLRAARVLKEGGAEAAAAYMRKHAVEGAVPTLSAPAKADIIAMSRPFAEWPNAKVSVEIQKYLNAQPVNAVPTSAVGLTRKEHHETWFKATGVQDCGYRDVQGLNLIFKSAINRYHGVLVKVENRNKKRREKIERRNAGRSERGLPELPFDPDEVAIDETGRLVHPPGINTNIYCYASASPEPFIAAKYPHIKLPEDYANYVRDPKEPIGVMPDRLAIPPGQPGHVPEHHRDQLSVNKHKRMRQWFSIQNLREKPGRRPKSPELLDRARKARAERPLLAVIRMKSDWAVVDLRGLLRNARWRGIAPKEITVEGLLDLFTGDPVIDPKRCLVTFLYKAVTLGIVSRRLITGQRTKETFEQLTRCGREVAAVSIDLGQTNPVAAATWRIGQDATGVLTREPLERFLLPDDLLKVIDAYRARHDAMEETLHQQALLLLSDAQREEIVQISNSSAEVVKKTVCDKFGLDPTILPWGEMGSYTHHISDAILARGGDSNSVHFVVPNKKGERRKISDSAWASLLRPSRSQETAKAYNDAIWGLKRSSVAYEKLSRSKQEFARRCANYIVARAEKVSQCSEVIVVIEKLNVIPMHGSGQRAPGWDRYFTRKRENRWFIPALHKALSERSAHRGLYVMEIHPARTSRTCPACRHCDAASREGEGFRCTSCGKTFHADLEVATYNTLDVALTGKALPKPIEEVGEAKNPRRARKRNSATTKGISAHTVEAIQAHAAE